MQENNSSVAGREFCSRSVQVYRQVKGTGLHDFTSKFI
jgi:hypothetical protein